MSQSTKTKKRSSKQTERAKLLSQLRSVQKRADRLREAFEYEQAIESYTEALKLVKDNPDLADAELEYELLAGRVACFRRLGNSVSGPRDLHAMRKLAKAMGDLGREVDALTSLVEFATYRAEIPKAERYAKAALRLAKKAGDRKLEADSLLALGDVERFARDAVTSMEPLEQSLRIYRELGDRAGETRALRRIGRNLIATGDLSEAEASLHRAIETARTVGDRYEEAFALIYLSIAQTDTAEQRAHSEKALEIFSSIRDQVGQSITYNNLGLLYARLGLYGTAKHFAQRAVEMAREMDVDLVGASYLESLGRAELDHGEHEHARITMQEGLELSLKIDSQRIQAYFRLGLGRIALAANELELALSEFRKSTDLFRDLGIKADHSVSQAWLGFAHFAKGDWEAAHDQTSGAVARLEALGDVSADYPLQDVWWLHYQVLKATPDEASDGAQSRHQLSQLTDTYAWMVLQRARQIVLGGIETLSDDGLRRNYLNKVEVNRRIIAEWVGGAQERDLDLELETSQAGNLQDQLRRMLAIGARMNERRELDGLLDFIMDQLIELSGAERVLLANFDDSGAREAIALRGYADEETATALDDAASVFDTVSERLRPVLLQEFSAADPRASEPEDVLDSLSVLSLPLISRGQLTGLIYLDNHTIYGPFNQSDVDLLSAFANQAASAIENARLYQGLEQRVADRTAELEASKVETEQRAAELQIINSVQEGLASKLEVQAIYDLVGDQMREIFHADTVYISFHDKEKRELFAPYFVDKGVRNREARRPYKKGLSELVLESGQPLKLGTSEDKVKAGAYNMPSPGSDKDLNESAILVPIFRGKEVIGVTAVQSYERHAFGDSDLRMLQTLTNSMSVALDNVRLFDETQDLLQETEQRAAELEIINSVQEGLASKLDLQSIHKLIGDRISEIFKSDTTYIAFHDRETNEIYSPYYRDKEALTTDIRRPYGLGFAEVVLESAAPLRFNNAQEQAEIGVYKVPSPGADEDLNQSVIAVPIISAGEAVGVASVQSYEQDAFDEDDIRLLQTLTNAMSAALENVRLFDETQHLLQETEQRAAELEIINSVQEGLASQLDFDAIIELVGEKMREIFNLQNLSIRIYDPQTKLVHFKYDVERGSRLPPIDPIEAIGFSGAVIESRQPIVVNDHMEEAMRKVGSFTFKGTEAAKSLVAVPVISGGQVTGVIQVSDLDREYAFDESDVRLLTTLAASMGVAFENARLFEETNRLLGETEERAAELEIISSVEQALASKLEMQEVFDLVGDKIRDVFDAQVLQIVTYDAKTDMISTRYLVEQGERYFPENAKLSERGFAAYIINNRKALMFNRDLKKHLREYGAVVVAGTEMSKSWLGVPLVVGEEAKGFISLENLDREDAFDQADLRLLTTLASSMSVALENVRLFDETRRRAAEMAALTEIAREVSATLDLTAVLEQIGERAMELLNARTLVLRLLDADRQALKSVVALGHQAEKFAAQDLQMGEGISGNVAQTGVPEVIGDTRQDSRAVHVPGTPEDEPETFMIAPLKVGREVIGTMGMWRAVEGGSFTNEDLEVMVSLSRQAAIAIQNARLFQEVERQKDYSESLVLNSPVAIVTIDEVDNIVSWNPEAETLFGYTHDEAIGQNIDELLVPEEMREESVDLNRQAEAEGSVQITTRRRRKDGSLVDVELHGVGLFEDGRTAGSIAIYHDISELKRTEDDLREQKEFFEGVLTSNPAAIAVANDNVEVIAWNRAAEQLFGYTAQEALGKNLDDLVAHDEELHDEAAQRSDEIKSEREFMRFMTQRTRKNGSRVDVEVSAMPVLSGGQHVGYIAIYYDISELLEAKLAAEAANEAKSAFLATMSHEIRTPMNAIIGMTSLLLDTELSDEQLEFTEIVRDSGDSLLTIINDILDFSKIEAGRFELESQPFDLRECIEGALDLIAPRASEKQLDLAYEYREGTPEAIHGDVTRLRQIFVNLLNNAVKFTDRGEVVLEVEPHDGMQNELLFCIRDTGIGIPPERMDRLFQSFSQVDVSTSRRYGGTGLGLAISKRLSELMGGTMWVESSPGKGSTFHFTIQAKPAPAPRRAYAEADVTELEGKRILIVDDNPTNRKILTRQLQAWGMSFKDTESPKQALGWIESAEQFEAAILDMHMPDMDGLELAIELRKTVAGRSMPLIMLTSLGGREEVREEERVEFSAFLTKPIKPSQLFNALTEVFAVEGRPRKPEPEARTIDSHMGSRLPLRILLAEDNAVNQKVALRILSRLGYRADVAGNGLEAIAALRRQPYDVVLMDMQMPELDGLDATRRIRKEIAEERQPRIIATTANAMEGDRELCLAAGMDDYVSKPLRVDELVRALSESRPLEEVEP